jgi:hypothetical protein
VLKGGLFLFCLSGFESRPTMDIDLQWQKKLMQLYPVYLAHNYCFEARKLQEALFLTLQKRGTHYERSTFQKVLAFEQDSAMKQKWRNFSNSILKENVEFSEVLMTLKLFLDPVVSAILNEIEVFGFWNAKRQTYEDDSAV